MSVKEVGSLVPLFFYDLIGSIVPGCLIFGTYLCLLTPTARLQKVLGLLEDTGGLLGTIAFLGFITLGYVIAVLLGELFDAALRRVAAWTGRAIREPESPDHQEVLYRAPMTGARLVKTAAEWRLAALLVGGSGILAVAYLLWHPLNVSGWTVVVRVTAMVGVAGLAAWHWFRLADRYKRALESTLQLVQGTKANRGEHAT